MTVNVILYLVMNIDIWDDNVPPGAVGAIRKALRLGGCMLTSVMMAGVEMSRTHEFRVQPVRKAPTTLANRNVTHLQIYPSRPSHDIFSHKLLLLFFFKF